MTALRDIARLCTLASVATACRDPRPPGPPPVPKNVVLIVIDTLRADCVGEQVAGRPTSPSIDALAAEGVRFDRAYAAAPWTIPSVATLLTGRLPRQHGVQTARVRLDPAMRTLAEVFAAAGYATAGFYSHVLLRPGRGYADGFGTWEPVLGEGSAAHDRVSTEAVTDAALAWLAARPDAPFFLFVHYFDPHYDYRRHPELPVAAAGAGRITGEEDIWTLRGLEPPLTADEVALLRDLYDGEIAFTDRGVGRLLAALAAAGRARDTVVALTADHGEEFMERGWLGHTRTLYEELVRVPLVVRAPGAAAGREVPGPVSLASLAPTLLDLALLDEAALGSPMPSLAPLVMGASGAEGPGEAWFEVDTHPVTPRGRLEEAHLQGWVRGDQKIVFDEASGACEAYDLAADPAELWPRQDLVEALRPGLLAYRDALGTAAPAAEAYADPEDQERLRVLGYLEPEVREGE